MEAKQPPYLIRDNSEVKSSQSLDSQVHSYLHILKNRKVTLVGCLVFCLFVAFVINVSQKPVYQASAELLLETKESKTTSSAGGVGAFFEDATSLLAQFRLIRGPQMAENILQKLEQQPENREPLLDCFSIRPSRKRKDTRVFSDTERRSLMGAIQGSLSVHQPDRGVRIISISATGYYPPMVARIANLASEAYIEMNYKSNMDSFRQNFMMVSQSLAEIRERIKTGEIAFQKIDSEVRLLDALKIYGERHPLVIQLRSDIPRLTETLKRETQNLGTTHVLGQRKDLVPLLTIPNTTMEDLLRIEKDLHILRPILDQEVGAFREMYNSVFKRLQEVEVGGGGSIWVAAEVVEPAGVPGSPIRPNKRMNLILGFLVGIFLGTGLAFFQEYLDSSVRSLDDVTYYLKVFPFGMVPQVDFQNGSEGQTEETLRPSIQTERSSFWNTSQLNLPLYVLEAYRIIRTNLAYGPLDESFKVLQVTSAVKGEGKTTTTCNLGISLAQAGIKTLLVDADMRRPSLHKFLKIDERKKGLSNALSNGDSWQSVVQPTPVNNLFFISAGTIPPNPAELLASKRLKTLLDEVKENFDMVLVDSPPVISVADSTIIASRVQGTILVSRAGFVPRNICLHAKNALQSVNGKVVGCILNGVQSHHHSYYYSRYYGYSYGKEAEAEKGMTKERTDTNEISDAFDRLRTLKEPFLVLLSAGWSQFIRLLKWPRATDETKSLDGKL